MATLVPEMISVLRDIRDIKYPDIIVKHGEVAVNAGLTLGYKDTALTYKNEASASASSALANKVITDANVVITNNDKATTNADASTCTAKALIASQVLAMTASASTLVAGSPASASYNPTTGIMSLGIPTGPKGDKGDAFVINALGTFAGKSAYDLQPINFTYYATDIGEIYFKLSATSGDWSVGSPFGKGDTGDAGNGIESITLTGSVANVDTYRILYTDATFFDFDVTNGSVTSVAGRTGDITLAKADVGLSNVDNTSDLLKPLSTAEIDALALKAPLASPALTGTPTAPTPTAGDNTTKVATTAFVQTANGGDWVANDSRAKTALNASGTAPIYACRAWVNFNGTGTVAIRASRNVSSITDVGTGQYRANYIVSMQSNTYGYSITSGSLNSALLAGLTDISTAYIGITTRNSSNTIVDTDYISVEVHE